MIQAGTGKTPLVFLHGWGMNHRIWQSFMTHLPMEYTAYVLDLPGFGFSPSLPVWSLDTIAEVLGTQLPADAILIAWSWGGQIALRLALDYPSLVRYLVLINSTPCFVKRGDWQYGMSAHGFADFSQRVTTDYRGALMRFLYLQCLGMENIHNTQQWLRHCIEPIPSMTNLQSTLQILHDTDLRAEISQCYQPTLLIHGEADRLIPVSASLWMKENIPHAQLNAMADAGHIPFLSHPLLVWQSIHAFIQQHYVISI